MNDATVNPLQPDQQEVPVVVLLSENELPDGFVYPPEFLFLVDSRIVFFPPWQLLFGDWTRTRFEGMRVRYPDRKLVPFARRFNCDDVACWEGSDNRGIVVVHDFASRGWEDRSERYPDFWSWYRAAVDEMIEFERDDRE